MTDVALQLGEGETLVPDGELVLRQICGWMLQGGALQTSAFGSSTADAGMPSYSRESVASAQDARDWHNEHAKSESIAVMGLTVAEILEEEVFVIDDTAAPLEPDEIRAPGHCFIDYRETPKVLERSIRFRLFQKATERGLIPTVDQAEASTLF
ncbi:hypothetical protein [Agrococcus jejuensis]|uniref:Uncharacterized protein n=1 Tax=Agrococcus jejuensis TaxID=399736 RepID=A0A1G8BXY8_9MICO|nr:hypothetical protein [Agrococcus jejuensis]SDH37988.1 hypothetical protein SAMN04489720_1093 [Agrococcus jejuensis]